MVGYIPSPSSNGFNIGPLRLHAYGFLIVIGVFAAVWLADRRWQARGGEKGTFSNIALWGVPGGLIGARLYSVITDYELYTHHPIGVIEVWKGGLGIWGGVAGGVLGGWLYIRRNGLDFATCLECAAPALPLAQAIGRWGNYFNQELFGRPTHLPWGVKINPTVVANLFSNNQGRAVPPAYLHAAAFQPTFLYESLWDLAVVFLVLLVERHIRLRKGYLFAVYVALYTFGRFFTEYLRIDFAHRILGLRLNDWTSVLVFAGATVLLLTKGRERGEPAEAPEDELARVSGEADDDSPAQLVHAASGTSGPSAATVPGGDTLDDDGIRAPLATGRAHSGAGPESSGGVESRPSDAGGDPADPEPAGSADVNRSDDAGDPASAGVNRSDPGPDPPNPDAAASAGVNRSDDAGDPASADSPAREA